VKVYKLPTERLAIFISTSLRKSNSSHAYMRKSHADEECPESIRLLPKIRFSWLSLMKK
jgi:hypothetical protein